MQEKVNDELVSYQLIGTLESRRITVLWK